MRYRIGLALVLVGVWLLWSGKTKPLLLGLGALSCLAVLWIAGRMRIVDREGAPVEAASRMLVYLPWLVWEIVKANVDVALRILNPALPIRPALIRIRASQRTDLARTVYANSITLTPGTVSVEVEGDRITVHALTAEAAAGLQSGEMDRRVRPLDGRG